MSIPRRSPAHDEWEHLKGRLGSIGEMPVPLDFGKGGSPRDLGLCDVSAFPRVTLKGPKGELLLTKLGIPVPAAIYDITVAGPGAICARTGSEEFFVEDGASTSVVERIEAESKSGLPRVIRQDISLLLTGERAPLVLAETCGFDFSRCEPRMVYSRVAGVSCSILQREFNGVPAHQVWADGSYGAYLWHTLLEIVDDLGGWAVGLESLSSK